jgi:hypothetical protein
LLFALELGTKKVEVRGNSVIVIAMRVSMRRVLVFIFHKTSIGLFDLSRNSKALLADDVTVLMHFRLIDGLHGKYSRRISFFPIAVD